jgi:hypothetical protein
LKCSFETIVLLPISTGLVIINKRMYNHYIFTCITVNRVGIAKACLHCELLQGQAKPIVIPLHCLTILIEVSVNDSVSYNRGKLLAKVRISSSWENIFIVVRPVTSGLFWRASPSQKSHANTRWNRLCKASYSSLGTRAGSSSYKHILSPFIAYRREDGCETH